MNFEYFFESVRKKKIMLIVVVAYTLSLATLYFFSIRHARDNAFTWVKADMVKRLDGIVMSSGDDFNGRMTEIKITARNNTLIMPLNLGLDYPVNDLVEGKIKKGGKEFEGVLVTGRNNNIVFNNTGYIKSLDGLNPSGDTYDCFLLNGGRLLYAGYVPVYYDDPVNGVRSKVGAIIAVYDFISFSNVLAENIGSSSYILYGFAGDEISFAVNENGDGLSRIYKGKITSGAFRDGFNRLTVNKMKSYAIKKEIKLSNSEKPFDLTIAIPVSRYKEIEWRYVKDALLNSTYLALSITVILVFVFLLIRKYIDKEVGKRLEINELRAQRHDFSKHLTVMSGMIETEEYDELRDYISLLGKKVIFSGELSKLDNTVLNVLIQEKELIAQENDIKLQVDVRTSLKNLRIDSTDLCTIVGNILDNAVEACVENENLSPEIVVEIGLKDEFYYFKISNTGKSIAEKDIERIFEPEYTTKKTGKGRGMGLYIVSRTLRKYHGSMQVDSGEGVTTFTIYIPEKK